MSQIKSQRVKMGVKSRVKESIRDYFKVLNPIIKVLILDLIISALFGAKVEPFEKFSLNFCQNSYLDYFKGADNKGPKFLI